jgi:leucyl aminopeptidase (aminopeptidase T)
MNERIKQLWEQAAKTTQGDSWEEQTKFMEKFAELIVRECASKVTRNEALNILEHFGVEE